MAVVIASPKQDGLFRGKNEKGTYLGSLICQLMPIFCVVTLSVPRYVHGESVVGSLQALGCSNSQWL
jgi:hypothetical protein